MTNTDMAIAVLVEEMGDRCLLGRNRRSGFVGGERGDRCLMWGIGDRVLWVVRGDSRLMWGIGDRVLWVVRRSLFDEMN
jgi:hypothetical protein